MRTRIRTPSSSDLLQRGFQSVISKTPRRGNSCGLSTKKSGPQRGRFQTGKPVSENYFGGGVVVPPLPFLPFLPPLWCFLPFLPVSDLVVSVGFPVLPPPA